MSTRDRNEPAVDRRFAGRVLPFKRRAAPAPASVDPSPGGSGLVELNDRGSARQMAMLDAMNSAAVMLSADGRMHCCNRRALLLLGDGIALRDQKLIATDRGSDGRLQRLVRKAMAGECDLSSPELSTVVLMRRNRRPLLATLLLVHREQDIPSGGYAILLITDPDDRSRPDEAILRAAFGLTPSEVRLARSLAAGEELDADAGWFSREAKLRQLRAIYKKTKTNRRRELVQLLISLRPPTQKQPPGRRK